MTTYRVLDKYDYCCELLEANLIPFRVITGRLQLNVDTPHGVAQIMAGDYVIVLRKNEYPFRSGADLIKMLSQLLYTPRWLKEPQ